jgi:hypothetical protein
MYGFGFGFNIRPRPVWMFSGADIESPSYSAEYSLSAETISLPFTLNGHTTDWGDGTVDTLDTHTYANSGTYIVTSTGADVTDLSYSGHALASKLLRVIDGSAIQTSDMYQIMVLLLEMYIYGTYKTY